MNMPILWELKADNLKGPFCNKAKTTFPTISSYWNSGHLKQLQIPDELKPKIIKKVFSTVSVLSHVASFLVRCGEWKAYITQTI